MVNGSMWTPRQRIEAVLKGQEVDRVPISIWRHWPIDEETPEQLAAVTVAFQEKYDFDFVKVMAPVNWCSADWGVESGYDGNPGGAPTRPNIVIREPSGWMNLKPLDVSKGAIADHIKCLKAIRERVGNSIPVIATIFSPLCNARFLSGNPTYLIHMRQYPKEFGYGQAVITETLVNVASACLDAGADGIFYAVHEACYDKMAEEEFRKWGLSYDLKVGEAFHKGWFNIVHAHGYNLMFDVFKAYPVQAINWDDRETPPTLGEGKRHFPGVVIGGIGQKEVFLKGKPEQVEAQVRDAIAQTGGERVMIGPGCSSWIPTPDCNIRAAIRVVREA